MNTFPVLPQYMSAGTDRPNPWLWVLVTFQVVVSIRKYSFANTSLQMKLEEIDRVQEPSNVDILLKAANEDGLRLCICVYLVLG